MDDITVWEVVLARDTSIMQPELDTSINPCTTQNNMVLNPKKCKEMIVRCCRHVEHFLPALSIDNKTLETVDHHKVLEVTLQYNLKRDLHINEIVGKASKRLHILRVLKRGGAPPCDLLRVYSSLIRSILEYCCPVWHSSLPVHLSDKIEKVQKRALRIIYPVLRYPEALLTSGFTELHTRRDHLCSKIFETIKRPQSRLNHLIPLTRACAHGRSLRLSDRPSIFKCGTERF